MSKLIFGAAILLGMLGGVAQADTAKTIKLDVPKGAMVTLCTLSGAAKTTIVPQTVMLVNTPDGRWLVIDDVTAHFEGRLVPAKVLVDNAKRITFGWRLEGKTTSTNQYAPDIRFRLTRIKATQKASLAFLPKGYLEQSVFGDCAPPRRVK